MVRLRRDVFGDLLNDVSWFQDEFQRAYQGLTQPAAPAANLWQDENAFHAEFDLPGLDVSKLDVTVTDGTKLTVTGERPAAEVAGASWLRQERPAGTFTRGLTLPTLVDADKVEAKYEFGVLKLTLPKSEAAKPRKINVVG